MAFVGLSKISATYTPTKLQVSCESTQDQSARKFEAVPNQVSGLLMAEKHQQLRNSRRAAIAPKPFFQLRRRL